MNTIAENDRVRFKPEYLERIGKSKLPIAKVVGTVRKVKDFGGLKLAFVKWDTKGASPEADIRRLEKISGLTETGFSLYALAFFLAGCALMLAVDNQNFFKLLVNF